MYTNSDILKQILKEKGLTVYDVHLRLNCAGYVYESFVNNRFTPKFIHKLEEMVGEDLSAYINSK
uniref:Helix-turn-helix domain protein n=1 Tax=virus sp. cti5L29 TaxID=2826813 RepID=A0A8S5R871_9VIRU|nr:MAG TPA: helix-turn-helix domain protein [virus sp. cti5L29]